MQRFMHSFLHTIIHTIIHSIIHSKVDSKKLISNTVAAALESFKNELLNTIDTKLTAVAKPVPTAAQVPLY